MPQLQFLRPLVNRALCALGFGALITAAPALAAPVLTLTPITWNIIGLDANKADSGPYQYPVGVRACNTGDTDALNVTATLRFTGARNTYINVLNNVTSLKTGAIKFGGAAVPSPYSVTAAPANCFDYYFYVEVNNAVGKAPIGTAQGYVIDVTADNAAAVSTPANRELYVEGLISQGRNTVSSFTGPLTVYKGATYDYNLAASTATGGYEQLVTFPLFPNTVFQVLSGSATYTEPAAAVNSTLYADACGWVNDTTDSRYRVQSGDKNCSLTDNYGSGKAGNGITMKYRVKILEVGSQSVSNVITDYSGSSYHYDWNRSPGVILSVTAINPPDLRMAKLANGTFVVGQPATYTLRVSNGTGSAVGPANGTVTVTDTLDSRLTYGGVTTSAWSCSFNTTSRLLSCTYTGGSVAPGATLPDITLNVTPTAAGSLGNTASVTHTDPNSSAPGAQVDADATNNSGAATVTVLQQADLAISKGVSAAAVGTVSPGLGLTYTLRVWNNGPGVTSAATVSDTLPPGLTGAAVSCAATGTAVCGTQAISNGVLTATTGSLTLDTNTANSTPDGNFLTYTVSATAPANGSLSNTAAVTVNAATATDPTPANNTSAAATTRIIDAVNDPAVSLAAGSGGTVAVLSNDTVGGTVATTGNASVTIFSNGGITGLSVSGGQLVVPASTPAGTYTVTYTLCDLTVAGACDRADAIISVSLTPTAGSALICDGTFYQVKYIDTAGTTNSQLFRVVRSTSPYSVVQVGSISPYQTLNGLGYNAQDNYLYALAASTTSTTALYKIGQGGAQSLGSVSGLPVGYSVSAGTIDNSGNMYVMPQGTTNTMYRINLSTRVATAVTLTYGGGTVPQFGDFAIHPKNGKLYGLGVNGDTNLYVVDLTSNSVTALPLTSAPSGVSFGTVFFDAVGELYAYSNTGLIVHVSITTGAVTQLSTADTTATSDGASCVYRSERLDVVKQAGTVTQTNSTTYTVPYTMTVKNTGTVSVAGVQVTDILTNTFASGSPAITVTAAPSVTSGSCTPNGAFNGSSDTRLLGGAGTLAAGASCTVTFAVRVQYPNVASIPATAQNNSMYASGAYDSYSPAQPNGGYVVVNGVLLPPPNVSLLDTSTNSATPPTTANGDTPSATPVTLPRTPAVTLTKLVRNLGPSLTSSSGTFGTAITGKPGDYLEYCVVYSNSGSGSALSMLIKDTVVASGPANLGGYGSGLGVLFADGATLASGATAAPAGTPLTSAADSDRATLTATSMSFNVGTLPGGGGRGVVCFKAQVP